MSFVYPFFIERCVFLRIKSYYDDKYNLFSSFEFLSSPLSTVLHCCDCKRIRDIQELCAVDRDELDPSCESLVLALHFQNLTINFEPLE
jgi:hypothetical protein